MYGKTDHYITANNPVKSLTRPVLTAFPYRANLKSRISTKTKFLKDENGHFIGFFSPRYTQVPDDLFDELLSELSGSELKVLLYIVRRTFGFKKDSDHISISQMTSGIVRSDGSIQDHGTGLHKDSVVKAVKSLVEKGILRLNRKNHISGGFGPNEYSLRICHEPLSEYPTRGVGGEIRQGNPEKPDTQETMKQDRDITLNKTVDNSVVLRKKELLGRILITCGDPHSFNFYRKVVNEVPEEAIYRALSQVKEARKLGRVKTTAGAMFTDLVKRESEPQS